MKIEILAFGIARDILGGGTTALDIPEPSCVGALRRQLIQRFPPLAQLTSMAVAVNGEYASDDQSIHPGDEVVLIPPVSGG